MTRSEREGYFLVRPWRGLFGFKKLWRGGSVGTLEWQAEPLKGRSESFGGMLIRLPTFMLGISWSLLFMTDEIMKVVVGKSLEVYESLRRVPVLRSSHERSRDS